ncbi:MAG: SMC-Scp complex subunit ScpB [Candidatus Eisenbacteria bacterium]
MAGGFQLRTAPELHTYVERFLVGKRRSRLSRAALETLAAVAYRRNPITRGDLEDLRGVDCGPGAAYADGAQLVAASVVPMPGRPLIYGTTDEFLTYFGLTSADLPSLEEFQSLLGDDPLQDPRFARRWFRRDCGTSRRSRWRPRN